jgi:hypothetical protein
MSDNEKRIRRARKLARKYGLRLSQRQDMRGGNDFWLLGPPRTFEDIEYELKRREQAELERAVQRETRSWSFEAMMDKFEQRREEEEWANRPIHPIDNDVP